MTTLGLLVLTHLLYDFHWQGPFISEMKGKSAFFLAVHAVTWTGLLCAVLIYSGARFLPWYPYFLGLTHLGIDAWKCRQKRFDPLGMGLYIDQALHVCTLVVVTL
jgi:CHASE2 domain-containing sensor protein